MKVRETIYADEGKILTNGIDYGSEILLAIGVDKNTYYEITIEEYEAIMKKKEEEERLRLEGAI